MTQKKWWMIALLAVSLTTLAACGNNPTASPPSTQPEQQQGAEGEQETPEENAQEDVTEPEETPTETDAVNGSGGTSTGTGNNGNGESAANEESQETSIQVYYTDPELLEVKSATQTISYKSNWSKYEAAFKALQQSDSEELVPLWSDEITINKLEVEGGNITLDLKIPATANLGSSGEIFAIDALKQTFFQFEEVESIELLVDGEQKESLMGHVDLEHPMTRE